MGNLLNMSGGSLLNKGLPYDAEIEYLESTGTQYIDTNIVAPTRFTSATIICDAQFKSLSQRALTGASDGFYFGVNNNRWEASYNRYVNTADTNRHIFKKSLVRPSSHLFYIDNVLLDAYYTSVQDLHYRKAAYLFALDDRGLADLFSKYCLYGAQIYINNNLLYDATPVRIGQVGYMYDKVSKQLFGNSGTGDFILGPDKQ